MSSRGGWVEHDAEVIRVLVADDHQAVRAGLVALLRQEPGFVPVATAADAGDALARVEDHAPDVALVDYHLPDATGVELCRRLRGRAGTVIYTAVPLDMILIPALVAGAGGAVSKAAPTEELFDAIRSVSRGEPAYPPVPRRLMDAAATRVSEDDLAIVGMAIGHTPPAEMAAALRVDQAELEHRIKRIVDALGTLARSW